MPEPDVVILVRTLKYFLILVITLFAGAHALPAARAAGSARQIEGTEWAVLTTSKGCIAYSSNYVTLDNEVLKSIAWSGECQSGQPITGNGTLTISFDTRKVSYTSRVVSGFWHGSVKMLAPTVNITFTADMGCVDFQEPSCSSTRPQVAGMPAQGNAKKATPVKETTAEDLEVCRAEIEESHRLTNAEARQRIASLTAEVQRGGNAEWVKWREDKRRNEHEYLDRRLQKGPMVEFLDMIKGQRRPSVIEWTRNIETEIRLLKEDPGSDQILRTVGITFTRETAAPRIAFQMARICTLKVKLAQLDRKPPAK